MRQFSGLGLRLPPQPLHRAGVRARGATLAGCALSPPSAPSARTASRPNSSSAAPSLLPCTKLSARA